MTTSKGRSIRVAGRLTLLLILHWGIASAEAATVTVSWDAPEPNIAGYKLSYGTQSHSYTTTVDVGNVTTSQITTLLPGTRYYFAVQAYNTSGLLSPYSTEVWFDAPAVSAALSVSLSGSGSVLSTPSGINCPTVACSTGVAAGTPVQLTATPSSGWTFIGWGGACSGTGSCFVNINAATSVTATFDSTMALGATLPAGFTETLVSGGLVSPTAMQFAPDGRLFVCEQGGTLRVIKNGALLPTPFVIADRELRWRARPARRGIRSEFRHQPVCLRLLHGDDAERS